MKNISIFKAVYTYIILIQNINEKTRPLLNSPIQHAVHSTARHRTEQCRLAEPFHQSCGNRKYDTAHHTPEPYRLRSFPNRSRSYHSRCPCYLSMNVPSAVEDVLGQNQQRVRMQCDHVTALNTSHAMHKQTSIVHMQELPP